MRIALLRVQDEHDISQWRWEHAQSAGWGGDGEAAVCLTSDFSNHERWQCRGRCQFFQMEKNAPCPISSCILTIIIFKTMMNIYYWYIGMRISPDAMVYLWHICISLKIPNNIGKPQHYKTWLSWGSVFEQGYLSQQTTAFAISLRTMRWRQRQSYGHVLRLPAHCSVSHSVLLHFTPFPLRLIRIYVNTDLSERERYMWQKLPTLSWPVSCLGYWLYMPL